MCLDAPLDREKGVNPVAKAKTKKAKQGHLKLVRPCAHCPEVAIDMGTEAPQLPAICPRCLKTVFDVYLEEKSVALEDHALALALAVIKYSKQKCENMFRASMNVVVTVEWERLKRTSPHLRVAWRRPVDSRDN